MSGAWRTRETVSDAVLQGAPGGFAQQVTQKMSLKIDSPGYTGAMKNLATGSEMVDRLLESLSRCFDVNTAKAVIELRQDELVRRRMEELGVKSDEGLLSPEEENEYDALIEVSDVIATLQLKARQQLAGAESS